MSASGAGRAIVAVALAAVMSATSSYAREEQQDHSGHQHQDDHSAHQDPEEHSAEEAEPPPRVELPPITDADRAAAFPDVKGHTVHDEAVHYFVLVDQLEWQAGDGDVVSWDSKGWIGGDRDRFWFRTEGSHEDGRLGAAEAHVLYGRAIARWWDLVAGVRHEARPGPGRTWAAIGVQGLAPYWFEVEATASIGEAGRTHVRFETEYEVLLTNRLILQPLVEIDLYGKSDPERGVGAGLSTLDAGLRLRYEIRRELAPYLGVVWERKFFGTAELARAAGEASGGARLALGFRFWF